MSLIGQIFNYKVNYTFRFSTLVGQTTHNTVYIDIMSYNIFPQIAWITIGKDDTRLPSQDHSDQTWRG